MIAMGVETLGSNYGPLKKAFSASKLNRNLVRLAGLKFYYDSSKACRELGYKPRPLEQSLTEIIEVFSGQKAQARNSSKKAAITDSSLLESS